MSDPVTIILLGRPVPGARAATKYRWLPKRQVDALAALKVAASEAMIDREMLDGPLCFYLTAEMPIPKSMSKRDQVRASVNEIRPTKKPDLKNLLWLAEDALTSIVYRDDCLICAHRTQKVYGAQPKLVICVQEMGYH